MHMHFSALPKSDEWTSKQLWARAQAPAMDRDPGVWQQRLRDAGLQEKAQVCEEALKLWPGAVEVWLVLVKHSDEPAKVLARGLREAVDPRLYEAYIEHIRTTQPAELGSAFEYALDSISLHPDSGALWKQYIDWLGSQPAANEWEETFRRDKVRKAYKKAVTLPLANIEALWRSYGQFETRISRISARKFIDERSAAYMKARSAFRTYQTITKGLTLTTMPSTEESLAGSPQWLQLVEWERSNPLELDQDTVNARVHFVYRRAAVCARWSPRLWFDAGVRDSHEFLELGAQAIPESYLLALKLAEYHETNKNYEGVNMVLRRLADFLQGSGLDSTPAWAELVRSSHRMQGIAAARVVVQSGLEELADPSVELYLAAAELEHAAGSLELESQIWQYAHARFSSDHAFVKRYLEYLFAHNDIANARSAFEQAAPGADRSLWECMLKLESRHVSTSSTDLSFLQGLEKRFVKQFPSEDEVELFMRRFDNQQRLFGTAHANSPTPGPDSIELNPNGPVTALLNMLPPASVYDGPMINTSLLAQLVLKT